MLAGVIFVKHFLVVYKLLWYDSCIWLGIKLWEMLIVSTNPCANMEKLLEHKCGTASHATLSVCVYIHVCMNYIQ